MANNDNLFPFLLEVAPGEYGYKQLPNVSVNGNGLYKRKYFIPEYYLNLNGLTPLEEISNMAKELGISPDEARQIFNLRGRFQDEILEYVRNYLNNPNVSETEKLLAYQHLYDSALELGRLTGDTTMLEPTNYLRQAFIEYSKPEEERYLLIVDNMLREEADFKQRVANGMRFGTANGMQNVTNQAISDAMDAHKQEMLQKYGDLYALYINDGLALLNQGYAPNPYDPNYVSPEQAERNRMSMDWGANTYLTTGRGNYFNRADPYNLAAVDAYNTNSRVAAFDTPVYGAMNAIGAGAGPIMLTAPEMLASGIGMEVGTPLVGELGYHVDRDLFGGNGKVGRVIGSFVGGLFGYGAGRRFLGSPMNRMFNAAENYAARRGATSVLYPTERYPRTHYGLTLGELAFSWDPYQRYTGYRKGLEHLLGRTTESTPRDINVGPGGYEPGKPGSNGQLSIDFGETPDATVNNELSESFLRGNVDENFRMSDSPLNTEGPSKYTKFEESMLDLRKALSNLALNAERLAESYVLDNVSRSSDVPTYDYAKYDLNGRTVIVLRQDINGNPVILDLSKVTKGDLSPKKPGTANGKVLSNTETVLKEDFDKMAIQLDENGYPIEQNFTLGDDIVSPDGVTKKLIAVTGDGNVKVRNLLTGLVETMPSIEFIKLSRGSGNNVKAQAQVQDNPVLLQLIDLGLISTSNNAESTGRVVTPNFWFVTPRETKGVNIGGKFYQAVGANGNNATFKGNGVLFDLDMTNVPAGVTIEKGPSRLLQWGPSRRNLQAGSQFRPWGSRNPESRITLYEPMGYWNAIYKPLLFKTLTPLSIPIAGGIGLYNSFKPIKGSETLNEVNMSPDSAFINGAYPPWTDDRTLGVLNDDDSVADAAPNETTLNSSTDQTNGLPTDTVSLLGMYKNYNLDNIYSKFKQRALRDTTDQIMLLYINLLVPLSESTDPLDRQSFKELLIDWEDKYGNM